MSIAFIRFHPSSLNSSINIQFIMERPFNRRIEFAIPPSMDALPLSSITSTTTYYSWGDVKVNGIYLSVKLCSKKTWQSNRDQFLYPMDTWKDDIEFQNDCLAFALFHDQNRISHMDGTNNWIPFTAEDVMAKDNFQSDAMSAYIKANSIVFSEEAKAVFDAGRELWRYYHSFNGIDVNASLFDIRMYFQGKNQKGNMDDIRNCQSEEYVRLKTELGNAMKILAKKIEAKVYEHGFLLRSDIETNEDDSA